MDMFDLASTLFGRGKPVAQGSTLTATGSAASADGVAGITLDADVTPAEGTGEDTDQTVIDVPTSPSVAEGDELVVTLVGEGPLKTPIVMANPGSGDRMQVQVDNAETLAQQAEAVATATGQHFWPDDDGVHVTEVTQEGWNDAESPDYHSGANVLLNALGQLFRDGLNNLLAIVTNGIAIYDGNGNEDGNILAKFYTFVLNNHQHARIDFFNGKGFIDYDSNNNNLHISARDDSTANVHMNTARINLYQSVDNKISNLEILAGANGAAPPAFIQLDSRNPSGGPFESTIYAYASELLLGYDGDSGSATITMPQAIAALTTPLYENSGSVAITTTGTGISTLANGPAVTLPAGTYLIVGEWAFNGNGTAARTCRCVIYDATAGQQVGDHQLVTGNGNYCKLQTVSMATLTSQSTIRVRGGCSTTCTATTQKITAVRLS